MKSHAKEMYDAQNRVLSDKTKFSITEAYKIIRTNIMFSLPKTESGKVIAITGSAPNEGKTITSINLAITFAQMGKKILVIDSDMRKSRVHRYLRIENGVGLTNVLCGFAEPDKAIVKKVKENLDVMTCGEKAPNPAELLASTEFKKLVDSLRNDYDYIFIDTPPVTVVTDAVVVAQNSDGVVVTVRENRTTYDMLDKTMSSLKKTGAKILGVVMLSSVKATKQYSKNYDYEYGYNDRENK